MHLAAVSTTAGPRGGMAGREALVLLLPSAGAQEEQGTWPGPRASSGPAFPPTAGPWVAVGSHLGSFSLGL